MKATLIFCSSVFVAGRSAWMLSCGYSRASYLLEGVPGKIWWTGRAGAPRCPSGGRKPTFDIRSPACFSKSSADGYDTLAAITPKAWTEHVHGIASRAALRESDSVFDVGCGAGAFLWPFREKGQRVGGLDYSLRQIGRPRAAMPEVADFTVGEALSLDERPTFDAVISCGTFLYFPDLPYAEGVLRRMAAKAERTMAILGLPDLAKKDEILRWRERALGQETYRLRYTGLSHLYYAKEWFHHLLQQMNVTYAVEDQLFEGYNHLPFRFNVFAWKG